MRTLVFETVAALLLIPSAVSAQQDVPKTVPAGMADIGAVNEIDFGFRGTSFSADSDRARYQRYQDLRDGGFLDRFRFSKSTDASLFKAEANHVGYRDQDLALSYNRFGKLKTSFEWNQTPLFFSQDTRTLYTTASPGVLALNDAVQAGVENKTLTLVNAVGTAPLSTLQHRRDVADFKLTYTANRNFDVNITMKNTVKNGTQPWGGSFGIGGAVATELPVPIDHRTTEVGSNLEWSNTRGYAKVAYDGSFFRNGIPTLIWDNPVRASDTTAGPAAGRMALWPNTDQNTFSAAGGLKLPRRSYASAYLSVGQMSNNDPLLPFTVNSALVSPTLFRQTADVKARVTAMNYNFTSRPADTLWFSARYRQYDFNNRTTPFEVGQIVNYDTSLVTLNSESEPLGYVRHTFDADGSYSPVRHLGLRLGYTREQVDRTYRMVENTMEDTGRASVDLTGFTWFNVRGVYEHSKRAGSAVDEMELLSIGEQPKLRQFDISDRNRDRFSTILQVTPFPQFSINGSAAVGKDAYPGSYFGLQGTDNQEYSLGFDAAIGKTISFGSSYQWARNTAVQASRTATPLPANTLAYLADPTQQFNDARRDWTDNSADKVQTASASVDFIKFIPKTDLKVAYDYTKAESLYVYGLAPDTVIAAPIQLPAVTSEQHRGTIDGRYFVTAHVAVGVVYWYDKYDVDDFALGPLSGLAQPAASPALMMLGYYYRPYAASTFMGRLTYLW